MPVCAISFSCISSRYCFPLSRIERKSSNSLSYPDAITSPLATSCGGSTLISFSIRSRRLAQRFNCSTILFSDLLFVERHSAFTGSIAFKAFFSCTTSRGDTLPTATLDMIRSKSPIWWNCSSMLLRKSEARKKWSTISNRSLITATSFKGKTTQRRSIRPPIGVMVLSMTLRRDDPPSFIGATSSRERTVKRSIRTYLSSSIRVNEVIWFICVCCVRSRYCRIAPAAITPLDKCSTPKPLRFLVPKCFSNFWRAVWSVKTQSSISNVHKRVPK